MLTIISITPTPTVAKFTSAVIVERHDVATDSDNEVELTITGKYYPGARGFKAHPMDRFTPSDDEPEIEVLTVKDERGVEIELSDAELRLAEDALIKAMIDAMAD